MRPQRVFVCPLTGVMGQNRGWTWCRSCMLEPWFAFDHNLRFTCVLSCKQCEAFYLRTQAHPACTRPAAGPHPPDAATPKILMLQRLESRMTSTLACQSQEGFQMSPSTYKWKYVDKRQRRVPLAVTPHEPGLTFVSLLEKCLN